MFSNPFFLLLIRYNWSTIKDRALQVSYGLKSLHDHNISHGDVSVWILNSFHL